MTLDNYIMESEINDATVGDIYVEQALAEMEVAYALASSYTKDAMFVEYMAEMNGVDIYQEEFVQESKAKDAAYEKYGSMPDELKKQAWKDEKKFNRSEKIASFKDKLKQAPAKAWEFIKKVASAIATALSNFWHFVTEKSLKTCATKLKELPQDKIWNITPYLKEAHSRILVETKGFVSILNDIAAGSNDDKMQEFKDPTAYIYKRNKDNDSVRSEKITTAELVAIFEKLASDESKKEIKEALKKVKEVQKQCDKQTKKYASNMDDKEARKKYRDETREFNQETMKNIKEAAKTLVKEYSNVIRDYRGIANTVLKIQTKNAKVAKKAEKDQDKYLTKRGLANEED